MMQTFYEHLQEDNSSLDSIGHDMPMSSKRKKQLEADKGVFEDFATNTWLDYNPPTNSSLVTKQELKILQSYEVYRNDAKEYMELVDTKLMKPFRRYFKKHEIGRAHV